MQLCNLKIISHLTAQNVILQSIISTPIKFGDASEKNYAETNIFLNTDGSSRMPIVISTGCIH